MNYKEIIESRYNRQNWQLLLRDIFGSKIKCWSTPSIVATSSAFAKQALWLGTITLSDEQTIAVYEVELADSVDIERNRRGIRDMLLTTWRNNGNAGAFMFCYRKNESVLRFSYVSEAWKFAEDGSYQKETTDARRFTYLLGEGHRSRTAIQQFEHLRDSNLSLKDLTKAFSVDAVSDMFFDGYKKQYENIIFYVTGKRMVKVANKWEERLEGKPCQHIMQQFSRFPNPEKAIRDYVKKLMGRLVFLQFLQKKGWLGVGIHDEWGSGDPEFIQNLFARCDDKDHFIDKVLEPLFNDLNSENEKKLPQYRTPYLNGGLFEQEAADGTDFPLPEKYMKSLLDFFASYNFTIDENDPDDAEVGVDPEMLGRIFENLLEDNKDKGAFYTPKEIVSYMCRESLIAYLQTGIEDETTKEAIRQFVTTHQVQEYLPENTDQLLKDVKICDPAIGSGAFPMGLLKELFLCRTALEGISQHQAAEIKKHIIQQNVYGVDIERGAVDIARLRFWLSLIVDEETPQALPNLDFKIMQGNSLLEQYKGVDLSTMTEKKADDTGMLTFFDDMIDVCRKKLRDMLVQYFDCTDHKEKQSLRIRIIDNVKQQLLEQHIKVDFGDLDLSGNDQFFLWHTWFHDVFSKGGFDIVIGNPPYIDSETMTATIPKEREIYADTYKCAVGNWDMFVVFIEKGLQICSKSGIYTFIIPNKLIAAKYAQILREEIEKTSIVEIRDYSRVDVFTNASVYPCTLICCATSKYDYQLLFTTMGDKQDIANTNRVDLNIFMTCPYWDVFFRDSNVMSLIQKYLSNKPLCQNEDFTILGAATVSEAYLVKGVIIDKKEIPDSYKIINTGTIDKYMSLWGVVPMQYIKGKYMFPRIHKRDLLRINKTRLNQSMSTKIIVAGMSKEIEAVYDVGETLAGKSTSIVLSNDSDRLKYLLGILNSKLSSFVLNIIFNSLKMSGGFLNVGTREISSITLPETIQAKRQEIISIVDLVISQKNENLSTDTSAMEAEIDCLVYQLYGLTYDEVLIVDPDTPITRDEYEKR